MTTYNNLTPPPQPVGILLDGTGGNYLGKVNSDGSIPTANVAGTAIIGKVGIDQTTPGVTNGVTGTSQSATYAVAGTGYTAYTTPQDLLVVANPANGTKTIYVTRLSIFIESTASALQTIYFIKRSTLNTGGTATNPALIPYDSVSAAATAVISLYTAAPTPGTAVGNIRVIAQQSSTLANAGVQIDCYSGTTLGTTIALTQAITLHPNESLCINYNGGALTAGFTASWLVEVVEK